MHDRLFETALGIAPPRLVAGVRFDEASKVLTVGIDFKSGARFSRHALQGLAHEGGRPCKPSQRCGARRPAPQPRRASDQAAHRPA